MGRGSRAGGRNLGGKGQGGVGEKRGGNLDSHGSGNWEKL